MQADAQVANRTAHVAQWMATTSIILAHGRLVPATTLLKTEEQAIRRHVHPEETPHHRIVHRLTARRQEASLITAHLPVETIRHQAEALSTVRQPVLTAHQVTVRRPEVTVHHLRVAVEEAEQHARLQEVQDNSDRPETEIIKSNPAKRHNFAGFSFRKY
jgi:hypothetical protein